MPNTLTYLNLSNNSLKEDVTVSNFLLDKVVVLIIFLRYTNHFFLLPFVMQSLCNFLAQPNVIKHLDISKTETTLEAVSTWLQNLFCCCSFAQCFSSHYVPFFFFKIFGALLRGCSTNLVHLNVSHNLFSTKKHKEVPLSFKQFFTSTLMLKYLNMSYCKLPLEALK